LLFSMGVQAAPSGEQLRKEAVASVEKQAQKLYDMGDWMYHNPEPGYLEKEAGLSRSRELLKASLLAGRTWM